MKADEIIAFIERLPTFMMLILFLAYEGYSYYNFTHDATSPLLMKQAEIEGARTEVDRLQKKVIEVNEFLKSLSTKKLQLRQLAQDLEDTRATLSNEIDISSLMQVILTEAARSGVKITSFERSGNSRDREFYSEQEFSMKSSGVFFQYVIFLDRVANLQQILRLSAANFVIAQGASADSSYVKLSSEMKINAYRYIGTKADDIGKASLHGVSSNGGSGGEAGSGKPPPNPKASESSMAFSPDQGGGA